MDGGKSTFLLVHVSFWGCRWCSCYVTTCCLSETKVEPTIQRCLQTWLADSPAQRETWPNNFWVVVWTKLDIFTPTGGNDPNWLMCFQTGWNHQLVLVPKKQTWSAVLQPCWKELCFCMGLKPWNWNRPKELSLVKWSEVHITSSSTLALSETQATIAA